MFTEVLGWIRTNSVILRRSGDRVCIKSNLWIHSNLIFLLSLFLVDPVTNSSLDYGTAEKFAKKLWRDFRKVTNS
jgi:hypothetical protein